MLRSQQVMFFLGVAALSVSLGACSPSGKVSAKSENAAIRTVAVAKVKRADLARQFQTAAEFRPYQEISMYAKVSGYVKVIHVDMGDHVKRGEILATLEVPEVRADLEHARASLARDQDELRRAQGNLDRAKSTYEVAHLSFVRLASVAKEQPGLVAQQEVDTVQGADREAKAQVSAAEAGLAAAREQLNVDKATLQRQQSLMEYANIVAPFDGVITQRYSDTGAMVAAGTSSQKQAQPVVQLAQNDVLRLDIPVPESIVPSIRIGMPVNVSVAALKQTYDGRVVRFAHELDTATRTMMTEIDVPNARLDIDPGMYATATITIESKPGVLTVPIQAISKKGEVTSVLRLNQRNEVEEQTVQLGLEEPARAEVISGLREGDLVVIGGRSELRPGEKVMPKIVDSPASGEGEN